MRGASRYTAQMGDKPNLDLLRSVAVTFVVTAHTLTALNIDHWGSFNVLALGPFGVYLFFVHTSLVLMWSLERRPNALDFYVRRAFRLYPLAILSVLLAAATRAPVQSIDHGHFTAMPVSFMGIVMNCLLVNGLVGHRKFMNGVMFMYLLLPALFFYAHKVRRIWPVLVLWVFAVLCSIRFVPPTLGNVFPALIPDFLGGVIAYVGFMRRRAWLPSWILLPLLVGLLLGWLWLESFMPVRMDWVACLALGLVLPSIRQMQQGWVARATHTLATYSYGVYLLHPFTIVLAMYVLRGKPLALRLGVELVPLAAMAWIAYHGVERPLIQLGAKVAARWAQERGLPSEKSLETLEPAP
jgi:peptidoglycan/LPS O-acetylase OafA/YrhL